MVEVKGSLLALQAIRCGTPSTYRFPTAFDEAGKAIEWEERDYIVVATTRPETMLGDTAVAVHPEDERYKDLIGKKVVLPLVGREIPIIADEYSDPEKGSGAVKITPAHDFNDYRGRQAPRSAADQHLRRRRRSSTTSVPEKYRGLDRFAARKRSSPIWRRSASLEKIEPTRARGAARAARQRRRSSRG